MSISPVPKGRLIFGGLIVAVGLGMMLYFNVFHKGADRSAPDRPKSAGESGAPSVTAPGPAAGEGK